ncbi:tyrosine-type recombinase/integrase [Enteractinococcus helveticum]|uniref:Integrase n=1 Tax=Enteractinococcus helveticum TaxID=1837282 RepID=A0A1B7M1X7_9MICC|nr:tyrosine-type recombinase/integrase [Enteractinococcus helveticum]OAV62608.1 integrase [Enteractinococcus helveticum]
MDITIKQLGGVVVVALRDAGYMESTIGNYQKTINALAEYAGGMDQLYIVELGAKFATMTTSPRTGKFSAVRRFDYGRFVRVSNSYLETGVVSLAVTKRGGGGARPVGHDFTALATAWEHDMAQRGLAAQTQDYYGRLARSYLVFLEDQDIVDLADADGASVLAFVESLMGRWAATTLYGIVTNFRPFLKFTGRTDLVAAINMVRARRQVKTPPVVDAADQQLVVQACATGVVSARDASITLLALVTGLRACDLIGLRLADIDWRGHLLHVLQQKTGNPVTLSVPALVITKLAHYLLHQRPATDDDHVFVRSIAPHTRLADHASIYTVIDKTFRAAGVTGVKAGTQLLRHNAVANMLQAAVALPTISAVLGHARQESTNVYLSVDEQRLLQCVLPIPAGARS